MPVTDAKVAKIIADTLAKHGSVPGCCDKYARAFRDLQAQRRVPGASVDEDLAAAEHYMFARQAVCQGFVSKTQMDAQVVGYTALKCLAQAIGADKFMRTTANPTSPASRKAIDWGLKGSADGDADHARCNSFAKPPLLEPTALKYK